MMDRSEPPHLPSEDSSPQPDGYFPRTRWSVISNARQHGEAASQRALADLAALYRQPVYSFIRSRGYSGPDADDLTQDFFQRFIEKDFAAGADESRGRFRTFLKVAVKRFLSNERRAASAQRRGGGAWHTSLDHEDFEQRHQAIADHCESPDEFFDRLWVLSLMRNALADVEKAQHAAGNGPLFEAIRPSLSLENATVSYAEVAARLGMSEGAVKVAAHRIRKKYRSAIREQIRATLPDPDRAPDIDQEFAFLLAVLSRS